MDRKDMELEVVDLIHLAQGRNQWRALVNTVTKIGVPYKASNFLTR